MWRLALLAVVLAGLAPGTLLRTETGLRSAPARVSIVPLTEREGVSGRLRLTGVWELSSSHGWFGGLSALVARGSDRLLAGSDRGFLLDIDLADGTPRAVPGSFRFAGVSTDARKELVDLESLARDPATDTLWAGFEADNLVFRFTPDGKRHIAAPPDMAEWRYNSGPETMTRLADGRFLVIAEGAEPGSETLHTALLYARDPATGGAAQTSRFAAPPGYDPVDAVEVPGGRLLILLRRVVYAIPARFDTAIAIADARQIRAGGTWRGAIIQRMSGGIFADNFEGIAFVPSREDPGRGTVWLVTDDNFSVFQRSLLVRFDWTG